MQRETKHQLNRAYSAVISCKAEPNHVIASMKAVGAEEPTLILQSNVIVFDAKPHILDMVRTIGRERSSQPRELAGDLRRMMGTCGTNRAGTGRSPAPA